MDAQARSLHLTLVSPASTLFDGEAEYAQVPIHDGMIGILPHHAPMVSVLGYGLLTLRAGGQEQRFHIDGGFLEIRDDRVVVLADRARSPGAVDFEEAERDYRAALEMQAVGDEEIEERLNRLVGARSRLRLKPGSQNN